MACEIKSGMERQILNQSQEALGESSNIRFLLKQKLPSTIFLDNKSNIHFIKIVHYIILK